jgi:SAM-dependent MidA family methyltransferase
VTLGNESLLPTTGCSVSVGTLRETLRAETPIPFDRFMQECLYAPGHGYYARSQADPGREGDFYTSVSTGSIFGRLLADHICRLWDQDFPKETLTLIEQGAHGGQLALDILDSLKRHHPLRYESCFYVCLEPQALFRVRQEKKLVEHAARFEIHKDLNDAVLEGKPTFFLSNELLDSFPVKLICYEDQEWRECWVVWDEKKSEFVKKWQPLTDPLLSQEISHWQIPALQGYQAEVSLETGRG